MKPALLLLAAALVGAGGCAKNDLSMSVVQMEAVSRDTNCVATATAGTGTIGRDRGLLDLSLVTTSGYIGVPVIRNNLLTNVNGIEFNAIQLLGANIKLMTAAGGALTLPSGQQSFFFAAAAGRLDPGTSAPMFIEILPATAAQSLAGNVPAGGVLTVIAEIQPVGMHSTDQVVGGPIDFPIDICTNCLLETSTCPLPKGSTAVDPCFPQQDEPTVCCNQAGTLLCGPSAPVATM